MLDHFSLIFSLIFNGQILHGYYSINTHPIFLTKVTLCSTIVFKSQFLKQQRRFFEISFHTKGFTTNTHNMNSFYRIALLSRLHSATTDQSYGKCDGGL